MINNLVTPNIRLFVFGTLRVGERLDYYMESSSPMGMFYTRGTLMESAIGSAYINFDDHSGFTIGELHHINLYCLQRVNQLEITWAEFPKGYELTLIPIWEYREGQTEFPFDCQTASFAFCYKRREATRIPHGDWKKRKNVIDEIGRLLKANTIQTLYYNDVMLHIQKYIAE